MADGYRFLQQGAGNHFYPQQFTQNHHGRQQIIRNGTPPNNLRSAFTTDAPSPSRSPDSHSPAQTPYGMFGQNHQQGQHGRVNGGPGRQIPMLYNFHNQNTHQQQHSQHHTNLQQDHTAHTTNGLAHHANYSSGVLSNATPSFTPSNLQNGHNSTTRGGQAQAITEFWAEQMRLHKESENANQLMVDHGQPNHFARTKAAENRGINSTVDASGVQDTDSEDRGRPYQQDMIKRQDWHNMDVSGQGLKVLATPLFAYHFLNELYVASNKITHLPAAIGKLRNLYHLDASFNQLTELPRELSMCVYLKKLLVFNNRLETLPLELGSLHNLEQLGIEGNPDLDPEIKQALSEKGTKALMQDMKENAPVPAPPPEREWIHLQDGAAATPNQEKIKVGSYNILCDRACTEHLYGYTPTAALEWENRRESVLNLIQELDADVICLQEVDTDTHCEFLSPKLAYNDYKGVYWARPKSKTMNEKEAKRVDGCAIFYKGSKYILLDKQLIDMANVAINRPDMKSQQDIFNRVMPRDNIAVIAFLENRQTGSRVIIVNTHLHWDPNFSDVKLIQMAILMEKVEVLAERWTKRAPCTDKDKKSGLVDDNGSPETNLGSFAPSMEYSSNTQIPLIVSGDMNSTSESSVYDLLARGSVKSTHRELSQYQYGNFSKNGIDHPFSLRSAYSAIDKTPEKLMFTNYVPNFKDVIDHIWYSTNTLELTGLLGGVDPEYIKLVPGFPNHHFPSDHLLIASEFSVKARKEKKIHAEPDFGPSSRRRD